MTRRDWLASFAVSALSPSTPERALQTGIDWLWSRQAVDGGWRGSRYGLLASGQSLTPFVLVALLEAGTDRTDRIHRALEFLRRHMSREGAIGMEDPLVPDYPNYATALAVRALVLSNRPGVNDMVASLAACLRSRQFEESAGWRRDDSAYGGWGMGGDRRIPPHAGHVDLSMTRHVLEALAAAGSRHSGPTFRRARRFLARCQNPDGSFFFSTVVSDANKAGSDRRGYRGYGTATADGILALLACGVTRDANSLQAAASWLRARHSSVVAPGFTGAASEKWATGLRYYYAASSAEVFRSLGWRPDRVLARALAAEQRPDGSWVNANPLVKEDEPLIATAFAVRALSAGRQPAAESNLI